MRAGDSCPDWLPFTQMMLIHQMLIHQMLTHQRTGYR